MASDVLKLCLLSNLKQRYHNSPSQLCFGRITNVVATSDLCRTIIIANALTSGSGGSSYSGLTNERCTISSGHNPLHTRNNNQVVEIIDNYNNEFSYQWVRRVQLLRAHRQVVYHQLRAPRSNGRPSYRDRRSRFQSLWGRSLRLI